MERFPEREVLLFLFGGELKKNETPSTEALGVRHEYNVQSLFVQKMFMVRFLGYIVNEYS